MSIPSSPPPLPADVFNDPPSSPPLPPASFSTRKRHADYDSSLSSDPIFSEDASEESELGGGLKKKRYTKGPWFKHERAPLPLQRVVAAASTNEDSGVWLGSDSSSDSISSCGRRVQTLSFREYSIKRAPATARVPKPRAPEDIAADIVFKQVDECKELVDLSQMRLRNMSNEVLRPLHQLIRLPIALDDPQRITDVHFAPFTPRIKLFLSQNQLHRLPSDLWNLVNIMVLSVWQNELTELSPNVSRLHNLEELNIAGNQLKYLPWELLHLILPEQRKLRRITLRPNPFLQPLGKRHSGVLAQKRMPTTVDECARAIRKLKLSFPAATTTDVSYEALLVRLYERQIYSLSRRAELAKSGSVVPSNASSATTRPLYVASSKITYLNIDESVYRPPMSFRSQQGPDYTVSFDPVVPPSRPNSAAPSMLETAARACSRSPYIHQLMALMPKDASPPVLKALRKAFAARTLGMHVCSVCEVQYVLHRARWIEYWFDGQGSGEQFLPFMRRACSWRCVERWAQEKDDELVACRDVVARAESSFRDNLAD